MERLLSVRPAMEFRQVQLLAPHNKNYGQKAHVLDAADRYALHRIARFAFGTVFGNNFSTAYGTSAAATILQHSALRQLAVLLEFDSCDPFWPRDHAHQSPLA